MNFDNNEKQYEIDHNFIKLLKAASLKATQKRLILLSVLKVKSSPSTAEEIFDEVSGLINLSTIYRALNSMSDKGIINKSIHMNGKAYFQLNNNAHKHQLVCSICHKAVDVENCPFEEISKVIEEKTGYEITGHSVEFIGICPDCINSVPNDHRH